MKTTGTCWDCKRRPISKMVLGPELCDVCLDYADMENTHQDYGTDHGDVLDTASCWVCHPELDERYVTPRKGHTNTVAKTHTSHAGHGHPLDPKHRAACRKFMAAHNGMDEVTYRVSVREAELDDAMVTDHGNGVFSVDTDED